MSGHNTWQDAHYWGIPGTYVGPPPPSHHLCPVVGIVLAACLFRREKGVDLLGGASLVECCALSSLLMEDPLWKHNVFVHT